MKKYDLIKFLSVLALVFTLSACIGDENKDVKTNNTEVKKQGIAKVEDVKAVEIKEKIEDIKQEVKTKAVEVKEKIEDIKQEVKTKAIEVKEKIEDIKQEVKTKTVEVREKILETKKDIQVSLGACKGCHGADFQKKALGKSKIVSEMTKDEVSDSLVGYKNGTYGGSMKGIMKGQVAKYSDDALRSTGLGK